MYHYNPYNPYSATASYTAYTSTTSVPEYTLQHNLLSLSNQQSRIIAQREQLALDERRLKGVRQATLRRIRAQRLREAIEEAEVEDIIESIIDRDRDVERELTEAVMYAPSCENCAERIREILKDARARKMERGEDYGRELAREVKVREMLDPSRRGAETAIPVFHVHVSNPPRARPMVEEPKETDTPVVNELPRESQHHSFSPPPQYFPEPPVVGIKRGSRRNSIRRDSQPATDLHETPSTTASETLAAFHILRDKLQAELSTIPPSIRSDVAPTPQETKTLQLHIVKLEDILNEVDAVALPTEPIDDVSLARKARREIVTDIVAAMDGIERFIQPNTPAESSGTEGNDESDGDDHEDNAFVDMEIQRVIRETLARKKDDQESLSRRSVTVEEVPDEEY
jgi:bacterioferritin-associated ferredoxin